MADLKSYKVNGWISPEGSVSRRPVSFTVKATNYEAAAKIFKNYYDRKGLNVHSIKPTHTTVNGKTYIDGDAPAYDADSDVAHHEREVRAIQRMKNHLGPDHYLTKNADERIAHHTKRIHELSGNKMNEAFEDKLPPDAKITQWASANSQKFQYLHGADWQGALAKASWDMYEAMLDKADEDFASYKTGMSDLDNNLAHSDYYERYKKNFANDDTAGNTDEYSESVAASGDKPLNESQQMQRIKIQNRIAAIMREIGEAVRKQNLAEVRRLNVSKNRLAQKLRTLEM